MITQSKDILMQDGTLIRGEFLERAHSQWVIITHGLGEHRKRHQYMLNLLSRKYNLFFYDLRGHGESQGERVNISTFDQYCRDLHQIVLTLKNDFGMSRYRLFGHSMGALVTASYMQNHAVKEMYPEHVFLSAPPVAPAGILGEISQKIPLRWLESLARYQKSIPLAGLLDIKKLSHDSIVYVNYVNDPLCELKIHTHLLLQLVNHARNVFSRPLQIDCPLNVAQGTQDVLVSPKACESYFSNIEQDAQLYLLEGAYHEMHNEIERYQRPYFEYLKQSFLLHS